MMKRELQHGIVIFFTLLVILHTGCKATGPVKVHHDTVILQSASGDSFKVELFQPELDNMNGALLQVYSHRISHVTLRFARRIAEGKYLVLLVHTHEHLRWAADSSFVWSAIRYLQKVRNIQDGKIALFGESNACLPVLRVAAQDTGVAAVVLLSSPLTIAGTPIDHLITFIKKPLVIIASQSDTVVPAVDTEKLFDAARQPKKLVWLASDRHGASVLQTDMEPIVRRVTLMLADRYIKNK